jgi:hypothetical protein
MQGNIITLCGEEGWRILDRQSLREMNFFFLLFPFLFFLLLSGVVNNLMSPYISSIERNHLHEVANPYI